MSARFLTLVVAYLWTNRWSAFWDELKEHRFFCVSRGVFWVGCFACITVLFLECIKEDPTGTPVVVREQQVQERSERPTRRSLNDLRHLANEMRGDDRSEKIFE